MTSRRKQQASDESGQPRVRVGMTLIELIIAMFVLSVGLLALAGVASTVGRQINSASLQTRAAMAVQSRFDLLTSIDCTTLASAGTETDTATPFPGIAEVWVIEDGPDSKRLSDTVRLRGRTNPLVYTTVIPCRV